MWFYIIEISAGKPYMDLQIISMTHVAFFMQW